MDCPRCKATNAFNYRAMHAKGKANYAPPEQPPSKGKGFLGSMVFAGIAFLLLAFGLHMDIKLAAAISVPVLGGIFWVACKVLDSQWAEYYMKKREWDNSWYCEHCTNAWLST